MERFEIQLKEPVNSTSDLLMEPPEDDPEDIDWYLWRYFHDHNRRVVVRVGTEELAAELDPDIRIMAHDLPRMVRALEAGKKDSLGFPERGYEVYFVPNGDAIWCTPHRWGVTNKEPSFACEGAQVIGELQRFLELIAREAVGGGYLSQEQAREFFGDHSPDGARDSSGGPIEQL